MGVPEDYGDCKLPVKALYWDSMDMGVKGLVVMTFDTNKTALMDDCQIFHYNYSKMLYELSCPTCYTNRNLVFRGDYHDRNVADKLYLFCHTCSHRHSLDEVTVG